MESLVARLEAATARLESLSSGKEPISPAPSSEISSSSLVDLDEIITTSLAAYLTASDSIGGLVNDQAQHVSDAFSAMRALVGTASTTRKPDPAALPGFIAGIQTSMGQVVAIKDANRPSKLFTHLSVVAEGIPALGWVVVEPTPVPYVSDMKDAALFYVNRVIKEFKGVDETQIQWANSFVAVLEAVKVYVKKHHTTGLAWNPKGAVGSSATLLSKTAHKAHVDSPRPPEHLNARPHVASLSSALGKADLTSGLRKVDKSEMTHKNPELRGSSLVPADAAKSPVAAKFTQPVIKKTPVTRLDGNKWIIEHHLNEKEPIVISQTELRHVVYIYNCTGSTIQINGKVNAVTLDGCKKVGLVVENAVSTIDVVNCKSCQLQITGKAPTVVIDKTDGLQLYLSKESLDIEILTAKSSEMNIVFEDPKVASGQAEMIEKAIQEQFKTKIVDGVIVTTCVEHSG